MQHSNCPPLALDEELEKMIEHYRAAKSAAKDARRQGARVEKDGHYDQDTPMQIRTAQEADAGLNERLAAVKLADRLVAWVDQGR